MKSVRRAAVAVEYEHEGEGHARLRRDRRELDVRAFAARHAERASGLAHGARGVRVALDRQDRVALVRHKRWLDVPEAVGEPGAEAPRRDRHEPSEHDEQHRSAHA